MPNQFTSITTTGFGSRIMGAIVGVPIGLLLIFGSCIMLYWNEGRTDYSKIAQTSVPVQADHVSQSQNGKFVSVTGKLTGQNISDGAYLRSGSYVAVQRTVEEYAWVEQQHTQSHNNVGGSQTNTTTYTYTEEWVDQPADSTSFQHPQGHQNPPKALNDKLVSATSSTVGAYSFDPQTIKLPSLQDITLSSSNTNLNPMASPAAPNTLQSTDSGTSAKATSSPLSSVQLASTQYLYGGSGSLESPRLGDIRISYKALPSGLTGTVFGQVNNGSLAAYTDKNSHTLYDLFLGDRQTAIATLHSQYETLTWILRGAGIVAIWIGLMMLLAPLDTLLDFIPIMGEVGGVVSLVITFPIALLFGGTVIIIGYTMHHIVALLVGVPLIFAVWVGIFKLIKRGRGLQKRGADNIPLSSSPMPPTSPYNPAAVNSGSLFPNNNVVSVQPQPLVQPPVPPVPITAPPPGQYTPPVPAQPPQPPAPQDPYAQPQPQQPNDQSPYNPGSGNPQQT